MQLITDLMFKKLMQASQPHTAPWEIHGNYGGHTSKRSERFKWRPRCAQSGAQGATNDAHGTQRLKNGMSLKVKAFHFC